LKLLSKFFTYQVREAKGHQKYPIESTACEAGLNDAIRSSFWQLTVYQGGFMKKLLLKSLLTFASLNAAADFVLLPGDGIGPGGVPVSASAFVDFTGDLMTITLTNTSPAHAGTDVPGSTLSGFFWRFIPGVNPTLTPVSATIAPGSSILGTCDLANCANVTNVGGEFGYSFEALGFPRGTSFGIASSGYLSSGMPGNVGNFNGSNLDDPASLDGINFGLISAAAGYSPNGGLAGVPVIQSAVTFVLSGATGLRTSFIDTGGNFQYGTSFSELNVLDAPPPGQVPEPASVALLGLGMLGLLVAKRR
jgi:hypothetical protein